MKKLIFLLGCLFVGTLFATPVNKIVVFGDSLSDNGNLYAYMDREIPMSPPYFEGRFSDGPVWVELLAQAYFPENTKEHLLNYAYGGAGISDEEESVFSLKHEINLYLQENQNKADEKALFVMWIGANNYLKGPDDIEQATDEVIRGIRLEMEKLIQAGAKNFLVINLPDIGNSPAARDANIVELLTALSLTHNKKFEHEISTMKTTFPGVNFMSMDVQKIVEDILSHPEDYGFTNTQEACLTSMDDAKMRGKSSLSVLHMASTMKRNDAINNCEGYLFFDWLHPTAKAHQIIAVESKKLLEEGGIEATV